MNQYEPANNYWTESYYEAGTAVKLQIWWTELKVEWFPIKASTTLPEEEVR